MSLERRRYSERIQEKCTRLTGEKVYPFTTTLPQQVAAMGLNFLTSSALDMFILFKHSHGPGHNL